MKQQMRHYEIVLLVHPDQSEQVPAMLLRYKDMVTAEKGLVHRVEDWGRRRLAYMINDVHKAHYVMLNIECGLEMLRELEKNFKFNDSIVRSLVLRRDRAISEQSPLAKAKAEEERIEAEKQAARRRAESSEKSEPEVAKQEVAKPEVAKPEVAEPEVAEPEVAEPEVTEPEVTEPEVTKPEVTKPEVTKPEVAKPEVVEPEVAEQEVTEQEVTEQEVAEPGGDGQGKEETAESADQVEPEPQPEKI